jgi:putative peptide zinc metalloprotease protein
MTRQRCRGVGAVVRVVAQIPNPDGLLRPRMSGYAKVQTVEMPVWVSFTRALARFVLVELWSWIP